MADLLSILGLAGVAGAKAQTAKLEGEGIKREREQKDLLQRLAMERQATQDAEDAKRSDLLNRLTQTQIDRASAPEPPRNIDDLSPEGIAAAVERERQLQAVRQSPQGKAYEERKENGGVAVYEDGKFKTWKIRPPTEKEENPMLAVTKEQQRFQREQGLADDFRQEQGIKDASGVAGAVATIRGALSTPTPQGDLAAIYALVKLYDPGSVVREGEISLTQSAASLPEQVRRLWQGWNTGKKLTPEMREAIAGVANSIVAERQQQVNPILERYGQRARQWGADSAAVAPNPLQGATIGNKAVTTSTGRTFQRVNP